MRAERVESGSESPKPRMTGNENFLCALGGSSISTPLASVSRTREPTRAKATGVRSRISILMRLGSRRMTVADSTQGICSSWRLRSSRGTKKMLRPMSPPRTSITWVLETCWVPVMSMLSLESMRKRQELAP